MNDTVLRDEDKRRIRVGDTVLHTDHGNSWVVASWREARHGWRVTARLPGRPLTSREFHLHTFGLTIEFKAHPVEECPSCGGTGIDEGRAIVPLVMVMRPYVRAMYPCQECGGEGEVESTDPVYQATMRGES